MAKDLVIVESPAKARTVGNFLGSKFEAIASMGHVRDLPKGKMGVEVDELGIHPTYDILPDKKKIVSQLTKASKEADTVYLATDPDREGEAISWHLIKAAKIAEPKIKRVVFHEITQEAIQEAFNNPRELDQHLVDAQQARRILDRLVGYRLSPVLWGKVRRGLSAGRVQSVALRLIVDREDTIAIFVPKEYWTIEASLVNRPQREDIPLTFRASLISINGQKGKVQIANEKRAHEIVVALDGATYIVEAVSKKETRSRPAAPFITSTLQQEAARKLRFTAQRTMQVAQQLYEGISVGDEGAVGLITYMRTDSTTVATGALQEASTYIAAKFGSEYAAKTPRIYKRKVKGAQEAHEAIRPTSIIREPSGIRQHLNNDQFRLYDLVWKRMLASQMNDALFDATRVDISGTSLNTSGTKYLFRASGSIMRFAGYRVLYMEDKDEVSTSGNDNDESTLLPHLNKMDILDCSDLTSDQHFTQPPSRYTEAMLIKALEEEGIGRPSTYAPIMATIMGRDYARKEQGRFVPTKLGKAVIGLLTAHFPDIMDIGFTARVEEQLDDIATGERKWGPTVKDFYAPFDKLIDRAMKEADRVPRDQIDEETDEVCLECERPMVIKSGRFGRFLSCSGFPECKTSRPLLVRVGVDCPECGSDLVARKQKAKAGRTFYGCSNYPACTFSVNQRPIPQPCPKCSSILLASGRTYARCNSCDFKGPIPEDEPLEAAV